jgi:hypothetical protein
MSSRYIYPFPTVSFVEMFFTYLDSPFTYPFFTVPPTGVQGNFLYFGCINIFTTVTQLP